MTYRVAEQHTSMTLRHLVKHEHRIFDLQLIYTHTNTSADKLAHSTLHYRTRVIHAPLTSIFGLNPQSQSTKSPAGL